MGTQNFREINNIISRRKFQHIFSKPRIWSNFPKIRSEEIYWNFRREILLLSLLLKKKLLNVKKNN